MAGRHIIRRPGNFTLSDDYAFDPRQARAFCDGMAYRAGGTGVARPRDDNPFESAQEAENWTAWDSGWAHADDAFGTNIDGAACAVYGLVLA